MLDIYIISINNSNKSNIIVLSPSVYARKIPAWQFLFYLMALQYVQISDGFSSEVILEEKVSN